MNGNQVMGWAKGTVQPKTKTATHHNLVRDWLKIKYQLSSGGLYSLFKTWVLFPATMGGKTTAQSRWRSLQIKTNNGNYTDPLP